LSPIELKPNFSTKTLLFEEVHEHLIVQ